MLGHEPKYDSAEINHVRRVAAARIREVLAGDPTLEDFGRLADEMDPVIAYLKSAYEAAVGGTTTGDDNGHR